jgi:hypothetical protein
MGFEELKKSTSSIQFLNTDNWMGFEELKKSTSSIQILDTNNWMRFEEGFSFGILERNPKRLIVYFDRPCSTPR